MIFLIFSLNGFRMTFVLHPNLASKIEIKHLPLCQVLLEDESHYPWIFLVPRRPDIQRIMDLEAQDQLQLIVELDWAQKVLWEAFCPTQINVAAIGNKTPQLHIHVIGCYAHDPAWPGTVWDHPQKAKYSVDQKQEMIERLRIAFDIFLVD